MLFEFVLGLFILAVIAHQFEQHYFNDHYQRRLKDPIDRKEKAPSKKDIQKNDTSAMGVYTVQRHG